MRYYCSKCFKMIDYKFFKPDFCSNCGCDLRQPSVSFSCDATSGQNKDLEKSRKKENRFSKTQDVVAYLEDDESDEYIFEGEIPEIKPGQGIKIEMPYEAQGVTFGQIFENPSKPSKDFIFTNNPSDSEEKILEKLKKESSNTREVFDIN